MLKRVLMIAVILAVAGLASAKDRGGDGRDFTFKSFKGTVTAVDAAKNSITVSKSKKDGDKAMTFDTSKARVEGKDDVQRKLSDIKVGDAVRVHYSTDDGVHKARRITPKDKE